MEYCQSSHSRWVAKAEPHGDVRRDSPNNVSTSVEALAQGTAAESGGDRGFPTVRLHDVGTAPRPPPLDGDNTPPTGSLSQSCLFRSPRAWHHRAYPFFGHETNNQTTGGRPAQVSRVPPHFTSSRRYQCSKADGPSGFDRKHLGARMPLVGNGSFVLFVEDANVTYIMPKFTLKEYRCDIGATPAWVRVSRSARSEPPRCSIFTPFL